MIRLKGCFLKFIMALLFLFLATDSFARDMNGKCFLPDSLNIGGYKHILNGAGFRTKFIFDIYACGLYLKTKEHDEKKIINANAPMGVRMHFVFKKVPRKKMLTILNEGFNKVTNGNTASIQKEIDKLYTQLPENMFKGDIVDLFYEPGKGIVCYVNGTYQGVSPGLDYKKAVFGIWLGEHPVTEKLKNEMLGTENS